MTAPASLRILQCPHCRKIFSRDGRHEECADCRYPAFLARQGLGYEDIAIKAKIRKEHARAIVFGKQASRDFGGNTAP